MMVKTLRFCRMELFFWGNLGDENPWDFVKSTFPKRKCRVASTLAKPSIHAALLLLGQLKNMSA